MATLDLFAVEVDGIKVGWKSPKSTYDDAILKDIGVDNVTANPAGVFMQLNPVDFDVPRIRIGYKLASGVYKYAEIYCRADKYAAAVGASSPLLGVTYKTGTIMTVGRPKVTTKR